MNDEFPLSITEVTDDDGKPWLLIDGKSVEGKSVGVIFQFDDDGHTVAISYVGSPE